MLKAIIAEPDGFNFQALEQLQKVCQVTLRGIYQNDIPTTLSEYDVFWFRLKFQIRAQDIPENHRCRYIICPATGLDHIDQDACIEKGIRIISLKGETEFLKSIRATSELALGLTISLLRNIPVAIEHVKAGGWDRDKFEGHEIFEKKIGILGVGRLGSITAEYFKNMGAVVYGYDSRHIESLNCIKVNSIEDLFKVSDILSIHLPYNDQTYHLVNKSLLQLLKPQSVIINTSRGGIIDSDDLLWALQNHKIAGAALDVVENEYEISQNELVKWSKTHHNLIITPHIGGKTCESTAKTEQFLAKRLVDLIENENSGNNSGS